MPTVCDRDRRWILRLVPALVVVTLYCRVNFAAHRFAVLRVVGGAVDVAHAAAASAGDGVRPPGAEPGIDDAICAAPAGPVWPRAWDVTEALVTAIARDAAAHRARFLAVTLSNPVQVDPDAALRRRYLAAVGGTDLFHSERRIQALGTRTAFDVLALAPAMQAEADRTGVFFPHTWPGTGHWNAEGHAFAGRAIARALCAAR